MPVDLSRYPENWKDIADEVRWRDNDRCAICNVENSSPIIRLPDGSRVEHDGQRYDAEGRPLPTAPKALLAQGKHVTVRCAAAHWYDHNPQNCTLENLKFACQQCHNRHDMAMRAKNISATKRKRRKT